MKSLILTFTTIIIISSSTAFSQVKSPSDLQRLNPFEISKYYINSLKKGVLLVRLFTKQKKIDALAKYNRNEEANAVKAKQDKINKSIIKAFKENFAFCPTYFFFSHDSKYILNNQLDSIKFLDSNLNIDQNIEVKNPHYLIAEFSKIQEDTSKNQGDYYYVRGENGVERRVKYSGGTNMDFGALIIRSPQLIQLSGPFPYYARTLQSLPLFRRSHRKVVIDMNSKLNGFFEASPGFFTQ